MAKKNEWEPEEWSAEDNAWYQQARQTAEALLSRPAFTYDAAADPLYRAAKEDYVRQGRQAMEDTLGRAAALSGGYASSYAQTQGARAYEAQLDRLAALLPDYYEQARRGYDRETEALRDELSTALGLYDKDYQSWLDRQEARERAASAATRQEQWEREFAEDHDRWQAEFDDDRARWEAELAQAAEKQAAQQAATAASQAQSAQSNARSYAYRMAMLALQQGLTVSEELLQTAGIDPDYAEALRIYYRHYN